MKIRRIVYLALSIVLLLSSIGTVGAAADSISNNEVREHYIEIEIPVSSEITSRIYEPTRSSPLVGNAGVMNAFFSPGQTEALSAPAIFNFQLNSIPLTAQITNVTVTSQRTPVTGVTYYIAVGRATPWGDDWSPDMLWSPTVSTSWFNGEDPWGIWAFELYATRVILNPQFDFGAAATLTSATLRIYYTY